MGTELEHLNEIRELLAKGWTQVALARDQRGHDVSVMSENAVSFCVVGAMRRSSRGLARLWSIHHALRELTNGTISAWNDDPTRTHAQVLALIDRAIEIAEAEQ